MKRATAIALLAALALASPSVAKPKSKTKKPSPEATQIASPVVTVVRAHDGWRADLAFDGGLLGWAAPRGANGKRTLYVLVGDWAKKSESAAPPCGPRDAEPGKAHRARLYRWQQEAPDRLELVGSELPEGSLDAADLDGDGVDELVLEGDGRLVALTVTRDRKTETRTLVDEASVAWSCCGPRDTWDTGAAGDHVLRMSVLGAFRTYKKDAGGALALSSEIPVPSRVRAGSQSARLESAAVRPIGKGASGRMLFATEPEPLGHRRLHVLLLDPDGPPETREVETWAMFPGPERVVDTALAIVDGAPALIVTTTSADKLSLLGEKALRVFPLSGDRTRAGNDPSFATTTGLNLWQRAYPAVVDLDGDGHAELVLPYWKGLKNSIAALEVYRGAAPSGFGKSKSMSFDVENGEKGFMEFGADIDGDGRPDLLLLANHELLVFPGAPPNRAVAKPVATTPSRRVPLPPDLPGAYGNQVEFGAEGLSVSRSPYGLGAPSLLDLDGDGRPEAVFAARNGENARVIVVFVQGAGGPGGAGGSSALAPSGTLSPIDAPATSTRSARSRR